MNSNVRGVVKAFLLILVLLISTSGCVEQTPEPSMFVCPSGDTVSDPSLCPNSTSPPPTNPTAIDSDSDGLSDEQESLLKTNPYQPDSDNDGLIDSEDPNPLVARITLTTSTSTTTTTSMSTTTLPPPFVDGAEEKYDELTDTYAKEYGESGIYWDIEDYAKAKSHLVESRKILQELEQHTYNNKIKGGEKEDLWSVRELIAKSNDKLAVYRLTIIKIYESDEITEEESVSILLDASDFLLESLSFQYTIKTKYPSYWDEDTQEVFDSQSNAYESGNQVINNYYDSLGDPYYKYYLQVNPNDPTIIKVADELTTGLTDEDEIKWTLLKYVRENVNYKHDPNWETDWIRPPAYTLLKGWGDCDDMAILLHSLYLRSGIDSKFAIVDSDADGRIDHATVTVSEGQTNIIWDATCSNCPSSAPDDVNAWIIENNAQDITEYIQVYSPKVGFTWEYKTYSSTLYEITLEIKMEITNRGKTPANDLTVWIGLPSSEEGKVWDQHLSDPIVLENNKILTKTVYLTAPRNENTKVEFTVSGSNFDTIEDSSDSFTA